MIAGERTTQFSRGISGVSAPAPLKRAIVEEVRAACVEAQRDGLRALVLTGSLARDEVGFVHTGDRWKLAGDVDLLAVKERGPLPAAGAVERLCRSIEGALSRRNIACRVSIAFGYPSSLRSMPPHIFAYELRTCGEVIWGDEAILSLVPGFSAGEIPLEDAWRLLNNRIVEYLEALAGVDEASGMEAAEKSNQAAVKLYLDMATSLLLYAGRYEPSYRARLENLRVAATEPAFPGIRPGATAGGAAVAPGAGDWPFARADFVERVAACTEWKLAPGKVGPISAGAHERVIAQARALWRWETARLTGLSPHAALPELSAAWLSSQPLASRLRGWAFAARQLGWWSSTRQWPRWGRLCWKASPRHCVYLAAAGILFHALPGSLNGSETGWAGADHSDAWRAPGCLPVIAPQATQAGPNLRPGPLSGDAESAAPNAWRRLAAEIAWNYHAFVEGTRA